MKDWEGKREERKLSDRGNEMKRKDRKGRRDKGGKDGRKEGIEGRKKK